jgi:hypothetical protein
MMGVLKLGCIAIYVAALAAWAGLLPGGLGRAAEAIAAGMLLLHAVELPFAFEHVRRYRGPLATSMLLTLLFGLLHWKPLADDAKRASARPAS